MFSRADLICPRCRGEIAKRVASCPQCGFDFAACERAFPFAAPPLSLVIDPSRLLPVGIEGDVQGAYEKVRKRFPQVDFSFCFVHLHAGVSIPEFAFWLHNAAPAADEARAWLGLVVGDMNSGQLAFTVGYALEPFVKTDQWESALQELAACVAEERWKEGLSGFLLDAREILTTSWAHAEQRRRSSQRQRESGKRRAGRAETEPDAGHGPPPPPVPEVEDVQASPPAYHPELPIPAAPVIPPQSRSEPQAMEDAVPWR